jgi:hypothetical protein
VTVRGALASIIIICALGCSAPPAPPEGAHPDKVSADARRDVLAAFHDHVIAQYEVLLAASEKRDIAKETQAQDETRERLVQTLERAGEGGARKAAADGLKGLLPLVRDVLGRGGRYAIFEVPGTPPSFAVVHVDQHRSGRLDLDGPFEYELVIHDELAVPDFGAWCAMRGRPAGSPVARLAVTAGRTIYLDRGEIERIGREVFLPRVDAYRALAAQAKDDALFAEAEKAGKLLAVTKDILRWRSLEPLWSSMQAFPKDEQVRRFAAEWEAREEVRSAIEARELELAHAQDASPPAPERLEVIERCALLGAIVHGEPLGEMANVLALAQAGQALEKGKAPPNVAAATFISRKLLSSFALEGEPGGEVAASARLARASAEEIRARAKDLLAPPRRPG